MDLSVFPRLRFAHLPTPLEPMPGLGAELGLDNLWVKRDDCTGLATGGNKTRKLEFLAAEAQAQGADTLVTAGGLQSNHCRQTAAVAARLGLDCVLVLEDSVPLADASYLHSGNRLLDRLLGAKLRQVAAGTDLERAVEGICRQLEARGHRPYAIPVGGSNPVGALGYVDCALELLAQAAERRLRIDRIVVASGSAGTQAGLLAGLHGAGASIPVTGISVSAEKGEQEGKVFGLAQATGAHLGIEPPPWRSVLVDDRFVGPGYGLPTPGTLAAVKLAARREGLLLDPVYTGKAMAGLLALARAGEIAPDERVVFLHTGGAAGLFAYLPSFVAG